MKTLLLKIQEELRQMPGEGIKKPLPRDIFLSADKDLIPADSKFPAIGIAGGGINRKENFALVDELSLPVEIHIYEKMIRDDASILSVFDLTKAVHDALAYNYLAGHVKEISQGPETPIQLLYRRNGLMLRKTITYEYIREEENV